MTAKTTTTSNLKISGTKTDKFLIVNGDDFGFSTGVNQAIIQAHQNGILTSTSLMVTGNAFTEAVELARLHPNLAIGLHLVVGCGKSVLPHREIPHLVDENDNFLEDALQTGLRYQFNSAARRELPLEIRAQFEKFRATGLKLSHVDGHLHHHSHPFILNTIVDLAAEFDVTVIRLPKEELSFTLASDRRNLLIKIIWSMVFSGLRKYGENLLKSKGIAFADRVYGLLQTGQMTEEYLLNLIPKISANSANIIEIYSHPSIAIAGESSNAPLGLGQVELDALLSKKVRQLIIDRGFKLTNYYNSEVI